MHAWSALGPCCCGVIVYGMRQLPAFKSIRPAGVCTCHEDIGLLFGRSESGQCDIWFREPTHRSSLPTLRPDLPTSQVKSDQCIQYTAKIDELAREIQCRILLTHPLQEAVPCPHGIHRRKQFDLTGGVIVVSRRQLPAFKSDWTATLQQDSCSRKDSR